MYARHPRWAAWSLGSVFLLLTATILFLAGARAWLALVIVVVLLLVVSYLARRYARARLVYRRVDKRDGRSTTEAGDTVDEHRRRHT
jgi:membrane protein implicated in regulation of membrane protease activity